MELSEKRKSRVKKLKPAKSDPAKVANLLAIIDGYIDAAVKDLNDTLIIVFKQHPRSKHQISVKDIQAAIKALRKAGYQINKEANYWHGYVPQFKIYGDSKRSFTRHWYSTKCLGRWRINLGN